MRLGSLFSGYGGLDCGIAEVLDVETVWHSEIDPAACKVLAHHWPDVPNLGDITTIDWTQAEPVDVLAGGWPCQPFSLAGKQEGASDARALWPYVADAVRTLRPRYVILENVAAIASAGELGRAVGDLAALGYVGSWSCLRASDVGAAHGRSRIFILAENTDAEPSGQRRVTAPGQATRRWPRADAGGSDRGRAPADADRHALREQPVTVSGRSGAAIAERHRPDAPADTIGGGRDGRAPDAVGQPVGRTPTARSGRATLADADRHGLQSVGRVDTLGRDTDRRGSSHTAWGKYEPAVRRWERLTRQAPPPTILSSKGNARLSGAFTEWLMGLPAGWVTDVPGISNNDALKLCGNGVVPQQAAAALRINLDRLEAAA